MDLILWRHAEAEEPEGEMTDLQRALTRRGDRQAARMAAWLDRQLPDGTRIYASPAKRTEQTARALGRKFKLAPEIAPDASPDAVLQLAGWPDAKHPVLIVGHQPTLGQTVARLLGMGDDRCAIKKASVWWLQQREKDGEARAVVVTVQTVELL